MAKHKKKRPKYVSKGERRNVSKSALHTARMDRDSSLKIVNKLDAWRKGKKGTVTISNTNPNETDKPFIKVSFDRYFGNGLDYKTIRSGALKRSDSTNRNEV